MSAAALTLAVFNLGGGEIILVLALVLILFGARRFPDIWRGFRPGVREFWKATRDVRDAVDEEARGAGESLGGIYGKPAAEALTPDNKVAELYDPAVLRGREGGDRRPNSVRVPFWRRVWLRLRAFFFSARA